MKRATRWALIGVSALCVLLLSGSVAAAAPGDLDLTFGVGGVVTTDIGPYDSVRGVVVQPDGKIVAAGTAFMDSWALARYLPDGSLDQGFGVGGKVTTQSGAGTASALALCPSGKLVVAGSGIARYLPNGALDEGFGIGGRVSLGFPSVLTGIVVLPDESVLLAGAYYRREQSGFVTDFMVVRLTASGALDTAFGVDGKVVTDLGGNEGASALLLLPDGKIVAVGERLLGSGSDFALARYLSDGSLDPTFGSDGTVITDIGGPSVWDHGDDAVLTADGKIVVAGASSQHLALARYLPDGSLDPSFGTGGTVTSVDGEAWGVAQQRDGKLVVTTGKLAVARFTADGAPDGTFGTGGVADAGIPGWGRAIALEATGNIIVAGDPGTTPNDFALVRYLGDPTTFEFALLDAQALMLLPKGAANDVAWIGASFKLGEASNGIDPTTEPVRIDIGSLELALPPGWFKKTWAGWVCRGRVDGVTWTVTIARLFDSRYVLTATATRIDLAPPPTSIEVSITIGDDTGSTSVHPLVLPGS